MPNRHQRERFPSDYDNIFFYYGSKPRTGRGEESQASHAARESQLENNTTKAFVNVIKHSSQHLSSSFLKWICGYEGAAEGFEHLLQRSGDQSTDKEVKERVPAESRFLIGISASGVQPEVPASPDDGRGSRADAIVFKREAILVAIEVKVGAAELDGGQLLAHANKWDISSPDGWRCKSWIEVFRWAERRLADARKFNSESGEDQYLVREEFLLGQLVDYLDRIGLYPGFKERDFDDLREGDPQYPDARPTVKRRLGMFFELVLAHLEDRKPGTRNELGELESHTLKGADHRTSWQTHRGRKDWVNFGLELTAAAGRKNEPGYEPADQLELNVEAWNSKPAMAMERWLRSHERKVQKLPDGYMVVAFARDYIPGGSWRQLGDPIPAPMFDGAWLDERNAEFKETRTSERERVAYHLRRVWLGAEVLEMREKLVQEIAEEIVRLLPLQRAANKA